MLANSCYSSDDLIKQFIISEAKKGIIDIENPTCLQYALSGVREYDTEIIKHSKRKYDSYVLKMTHISSGTLLGQQFPMNSGHPLLQAIQTGHKKSFRTIYQLK